jgi:aryl-alcohol dehydrogenase-like predicted oxidoreductase
MEYAKLGRTGLEVSRICLGCMSYGVPDQGNHAWSIDEEDSRPFIKRALEGGINFFDTANRYSLGSSEEILGRAIKDFARRDEVVIATKVYGRMRPGPNGGGLSRKAIMREIDDSLRRLGTDYVDLYQIHRWDHGTPIEETLEALHDIVKAGKVRYIGASSMHAWQFARALGISERHGWTRFVSMQNLVNLLYREEEREMLPLCAAEGIGVIPWSPQARGRLTRDWDYTSIRTETDDAHQRLFAKSEEADRKVVVVEGDPRLLNRYDVILLNPEKHPVPKQALAQRFAQWLLSPEGQAAIGGYEVAGEQLFHPSAAAPK